MVKNHHEIVQVHLRKTEKQDNLPVSSENAASGIACKLVKDGVEFTLFNGAEMCIVYEVLREVFPDDR